MGFKTKVNRRDTLQLITTEQYTIPATSPYKIKLNEIPDKTAGVTISGFTEKTSLPAAAGEFYVDYVRGEITFFSANASQSVNPQYWGKGSRIDADDFNDITKELTRSMAITHSLRPYAQDTSDRTIGILAGSFYLGNILVSFAGNSSVNLGPGGAYQVAATTANYYKKILFAINSSGTLKKYEGTQSSTSAGATAPSFPADEIQVCIVTVQDDGSAGAGTIKNIQSSDIQDVRPFLLLPSASRRQITFYHEAYPTAGDVFVNGYKFKSAVTVDRAFISARSAPSGGNLIIALLKGGAEVGRDLILLPGETGKIIDLQALSFLTTDTLGLKITGADTGATAEGIQVILEYY